MARDFTVTGEARLDTRRAETDLSKFVKKAEGININLKGIDHRKFTQPLGKITGSVSEFHKSLEASNARVIAFTASAGILFTVVRAFKEMASATIEVEATLKDINVILGASSNKLREFSSSLFQVAKNTGQSFYQVGEAATEFARQGLSMEKTLTRTRDALILMRLSGMDATSAVNSLTAAINSFNQTALTSTEIINKMANVDAAFAVSTNDLAEAIRRVGSTAEDVNVSFDELIATVTSVQQTTARGGNIIGNSLKTIFTRIQRTQVIDQMKQLGVQVRTTTGEMRPAMVVLAEFAKVYEGLAGPLKSSTAELIGGVYQMNILKALLKDLRKEYSIYSGALQTANNSTDEAIRRNEELNKTLKAMLNESVQNLTKFGAEVGSLSFEPVFKKIIGGFNSLSKEVTIFGDIGKFLGIDEKDANEFGGRMARGVMKSIGRFLEGPGLIALVAIAGKLFIDFTMFLGRSLKDMMGLNKASHEQAIIQQQISTVLQKNPELIMKIEKGELSRLDVERSIITALKDEIRMREKIAKMAKTMTPMVGSSVGAVTNKSAGTTNLRIKSKGHIPSLSSAGAEYAEMIGAMQAGYKPGEVRELSIPNFGRVTYNTAETVKKFEGIEQPAIIPPGKAGKKYAEKFESVWGFDPRNSASYGLLPNLMTVLTSMRLGVHRQGKQGASGKLQISGAELRHNLGPELGNIIGHVIPPGEMITINTMGQQSPISKKEASGFTKGKGRLAAQKGAQQEAAFAKRRGGVSLESFRGRAMIARKMDPSRLKLPYDSGEMAGKGANARMYPVESKPSFRKRYVAQIFKKTLYENNSSALRHITRRLKAKMESGDIVAGKHLDTLQKRIGIETRNRDLELSQWTMGGQGPKVGSLRDMNERMGFDTRNAVQGWREQRAGQRIFGYDGFIPNLIKTPRRIGGVGAKGAKVYDATQSAAMLIPEAGITSVGGRFEEATLPGTKTKFRFNVHDPDLGKGKKDTLHAKVTKAVTKIAIDYAKEIRPPLNTDPEPAQYFNSGAMKAATGNVFEAAMDAAFKRNRDIETATWDVKAGTPGAGRVRKLFGIRKEMHADYKVSASKGNKSSFAKKIWTQFGKQIERNEKQRASAKKSSKLKYAGFIPQFSALSDAFSTEAALGGDPTLDYHPRVGLMVRDNKTQKSAQQAISQHSEGLPKALRNSKSLQKAFASEGFVPNFAEPPTTGFDTATITASIGMAAFGFMMMRDASKGVSDNFTELQGKLDQVMQTEDEMVAAHKAASDKLKQNTDELTQNTQDQKGEATKQEKLQKDIDKAGSKRNQRAVGGAPGANAVAEAKREGHRGKAKDKRAKQIQRAMDDKLVQDKKDLKESKLKTADLKANRKQTKKNTKGLEDENRESKASLKAAKEGTRAQRKLAVAHNRQAATSQKNAVRDRKGMVGQHGGFLGGGATKGGMAMNRMGGMAMGAMMIMPAISGMATGAMGESRQAQGVIGGAEMAATGAMAGGMVKMAGIGGAANPYIAGAIAAIGVLAGVYKVLDGFLDPMKDLQATAEEAKEKLTEFSNATQTYLQSFEGFNEALQDPSIATDEFIKRRDAMEDSFRDLPAHIRTQFQYIKKDAKSIAEFFEKARKSLQDKSRQSEAGVALQSIYEEERGWATDFSRDLTGLIGLQALGWVEEGDRIFDDTATGRKARVDTTQMFQREVTNDMIKSDKGSKAIAEMQGFAGRVGGKMSKDELAEYVKLLEDLEVPTDYINWFKLLQDNREDAADAAKDLAASLKETEQQLKENIEIEKKRKKELEELKKHQAVMKELAIQQRILNSTLKKTVEIEKNRVHVLNKLRFGRDDFDIDMSSMIAKKSLELATPFLGKIEKAFLSMQLQLGKVSIDERRKMRTAVTKAIGGGFDLATGEFNKASQALETLIAADTTGVEGKNILLQIAKNQKLQSQLMPLINGLMQRMKTDGRSFNFTNDDIAALAIAIAKGGGKNAREHAELIRISIVALGEKLHGELAVIAAEAEKQRLILKNQQRLQEKIIKQEERLSSFGGPNDFLTAGVFGLGKNIDSLKKTLELINKATLFGRGSGIEGFTGMMEGERGSYVQGPGGVRSGRMAYGIIDKLVNNLNLRDADGKRLKGEDFGGLMGMALKGHAENIRMQSNYFRDLTAASYGGKLPDDVAKAFDRVDPMETAVEQIANKLKINNIAPNVEEINQGIKVLNMMIESQGRTLYENNRRAFRDALSDANATGKDHEKIAQEQGTYDRENASQIGSDMRQEIISSSGTIVTASNFHRRQIVQTNYDGFSRILDILNAYRDVQQSQALNTELRDITRTGGLRDVNQTDLERLNKIRSLERQKAMEGLGVGYGLGSQELQAQYSTVRSRYELFINQPNQRTKRRGKSAKWQANLGGKAKAEAAAAMVEVMDTAGTAAMMNPFGMGTDMHGNKFRGGERSPSAIYANMPSKSKRIMEKAGFNPRLGGTARQSFKSENITWKELDYLFIDFWSNFGRMGPRDSAIGGAGSDQAKVSYGGRVAWQAVEAAIRKLWPGEAGIRGPVFGQTELTQVANILADTTDIAGRSQFGIPGAGGIRGRMFNQRGQREGGGGAGWRSEKLKVDSNLAKFISLVWNASPAQREYAEFGNQDMWGPQVSAAFPGGGAYKPTYGGLTSKYGPNAGAYSAFNRNFPAAGGLVSPTEPGLAMQPGYQGVTGIPSNVLGGDLLQSLRLMATPSSGMAAGMGLPSMPAAAAQALYDNLSKAAQEYNESVMALAKLKVREGVINADLLRIKNQQLQRHTKILNQLSGLGSTIGSHWWPAPTASRQYTGWKTQAQMATLPGAQAQKEATREATSLFTTSAYEGNWKDKSDKMYRANLLRYQLGQKIMLEPGLPISGAGVQGSLENFGMNKFQQGPGGAGYNIFAKSGRPDPDAIKKALTATDDWLKEFAKLGLDDKDANKVAMAKARLVIGGGTADDRRRIQTTLGINPADIFDPAGDIDPDKLMAVKETMIRYGDLFRNVSSLSKNLQVIELRIQNLLTLANLEKKEFDVDSMRQVVLAKHARDQKELLKQKIATADMEIMLMEADPTTERGKIEQKRQKNIQDKLIAMRADAGPMLGSLAQFVNLDETERKKKIRGQLKQKYGYTGIKDMLKDPLHAVKMKPGEILELKKQEDAMLSAFKGLVSLMIEYVGNQVQFLNNQVRDLKDQVFFEKHDPTMYEVERTEGRTKLHESKIRQYNTRYGENAAIRDMRAGAPESATSGGGGFFPGPSSNELEDAVATLKGLQVWRQVQRGLIEAPGGTPWDPTEIPGGGFQMWQEKWKPGANILPPGGGPAIGPGAHEYQFYGEEGEKLPGFSPSEAARKWVPLRGGDVNEQWNKEWLAYLKQGQERYNLTDITIAQLTAQMLKTRKFEEEAQKRYLEAFKKLQEVWRQYGVDRITDFDARIKATEREVFALKQDPTLVTPQSRQGLRDAGTRRERQALERTQMPTPEILPYKKIKWTPTDNPFWNFFGITRLPAGFEEGGGQSFETGKQPHFGWEKWNPDTGRQERGALAEGMETGAYGGPLGTFSSYDGPYDRYAGVAKEREKGMRDQFEQVQNDMFETLVMMDKGFDNIQEVIDGLATQTDHRLKFFRKHFGDIYNEYEKGSAAYSQQQAILSEVQQRMSYAFRKRMRDVHEAVLMSEQDASLYESERVKIRKKRTEVKLREFYTEHGQGTRWTMGGSISYDRMGNAAETEADIRATTLERDSAVKLKLEANDKWGAAEKKRQGLFPLDDWMTAGGAGGHMGRVEAMDRARAIYSQAGKTLPEFESKLGDQPPRGMDAVTWMRLREKDYIQYVLDIRSKSQDILLEEQRNLDNLSDAKQTQIDHQDKELDILKKWNAILKTLRRDAITEQASAIQDMEREIMQLRAGGTSEGRRKADKLQKDLEKTEFEQMLNLAPNEKIITEDREVPKAKYGDLSKKRKRKAYNRAMARYQKALADPETSTSDLADLNPNRTIRGGQIGPTGLGPAYEPAGLGIGATKKTKTWSDPKVRATFMAAISGAWRSQTSMLETDIQETGAKILKAELDGTPPEEVMEMKEKQLKDQAELFRLKYGDVWNKYLEGSMAAGEQEKYIAELQKLQAAQLGAKMRDLNQRIFEEQKNLSLSEQDRLPAKAEMIDKSFEARRQRRKGGPTVTTGGGLQYKRDATGKIVVESGVPQIEAVEPKEVKPYEFKDTVKHIKDTWKYDTEDMAKSGHNALVEMSGSFQTQSAKAFASAIKGAETLEKAFQKMFESLADFALEKVLEMAMKRFVFNTIAGLGAKGGLATSEGFQHYARGGQVTGGGGTVDDVPALLKQGEYVVRQGAVKKYGVSYFDLLNSNQYKPRQEVMGYAAGGQVGSNRGHSFGSYDTSTGVVRYPDGTSVRIQDMEGIRRGRGLPTYTHNVPEDERGFWESKTYKVDYWKHLIESKERGGLAMDPRDVAKLRRKWENNAFADPQEGLYSRIQSGDNYANLALRNAFIYDSDKFPTLAGSYYHVDPRLSTQALLDPNNPRNKIRQDKVSALYGHYQSRQDDLQQWREDMIEAKKRKEDRMKKTFWLVAGLSLMGMMFGENMWGSNNNFGQRFMGGASNFWGRTKNFFGFGGGRGPGQNLGAAEPNWAGGIVTKKAAGGMNGPDNVPAMLMSGEYVMNRGAVDHYGLSFFSRLNKGLEDVPNFAEGGYVTSGKSNTTPSSSGSLFGNSSAGDIQNNITINVTVSQDGSESNSVLVGGGRKGDMTFEEAHGLSEMIKSKVIETLIQHKRQGGLLYRT